jgi:hypothetical protein
MVVLDMSCHIIHWVLHFHRYYFQYSQYQREIDDTLTELGLPFEWRSAEQMRDQLGTGL